MLVLLVRLDSELAGLSSSASGRRRARHWYEPRHRHHRRRRLWLAPEQRRYETAPRQALRARGNIAAAAAAAAPTIAGAIDDGRGGGRSDTHFFDAVVGMAVEAQGVGVTSPPASSPAEDEGDDAADGDGYAG